MSSFRGLLGIELNPVTPKEKALSALGGIVSIFLLILITEHYLGLPQSVALVGSMGASAVLLFGMPHGPLSQPWPVIAGHGFSALIGVTCAKWIHSPEWAAACAVGLSIGVMHQLKCIHPPGGATALTAVLGGQAIRDMGFDFVLCPVLLNGVVMVSVAFLFNLPFGWRRYPSSLGRVPSANRGSAPSHEDVTAALRQLDSFVDVSEDDLIRLCEILSPQPAAGKTLVRSQP
jgi:CBS-domain-containing membrane protein